MAEWMDGWLNLDDSLMASGLTSAQTARISTRLSKRAGIAVSPIDIYTYPTIAGLADHIARRPKSTCDTSTPSNVSPAPGMQPRQVEQQRESIEGRMPDQTSYDYLIVGCGASGFTSLQVLKFVEPDARVTMIDIDQTSLIPARTLAKPQDP